MQTIPIQGMTQDVVHILTHVPSLNFLKYQLVGLQLPCSWGVSRCIYKVGCKR